MSLPRFRRHLSPLRSFSASLALIALTGCETDERSSRRGAPAPATGAAVPVPATPDMSVHGTFFAGQLETEILLGHAGFAARAKGPDGTSPGSGDARGRGGFGGGLGGGSRRRGGGEPGEARGGPTPARSSDGAPAPPIVAANRPPMRLHLRLTNHRSEPVDVEVLDFNSDLGNFVVQPRKFSLPPGASVAADPMTSRIGLTADAIPVTVRLRRKGQIEQQVLLLQPVLPPTPAANPPPAAP